ncbi:MAG: hypothetical protein Q4B96_07685, partial [Bacillota bacterium]|nr:hypothetical protein [Bacillota bacterium]
QEIVAELSAEQQEIVEEAVPLAEAATVVEANDAAAAAETEIVEQALPLADAPQTGDGAQTALWALLMLAAVVGVAYSFKASRVKA